MYCDWEKRLSSTCIRIFPLARPLSRLPENAPYFMGRIFGSATGSEGAGIATRFTRLQIIKISPEYILGLNYEPESVNTFGGPDD